MKKKVRIRFSGPGFQTGVSEPLGFWRFIMACVFFWRRSRTGINGFDTMVAALTEMEP